MWQEIVLSICLYYIGFFTGKKRGKSEQHKEDYDEVVKTIQELKDSKEEEKNPKDSFIVITKKSRM